MWRSLNGISVTIDESNKDDFFILVRDMQGNIYCVEYTRNENTIKIIDVFNYVDSTSLKYDDLLLRNIINIIERECDYIVE